MTSTSSNGYIGPGLTVRGHLAGEGRIAIAGRFEGEVAIRGDIEVAPGGVVRAPVRAERVEVAGRLVGDVRASVGCAVRRGGALEGDVRAARVSLEDGGQLAGAVEMDFELPPDQEGR